MRGAAYSTRDRVELLASYRRQVGTGERLPDIGFRLLLGITGQQARDEE